MESLIRVEGKFLRLNVANIDTDAIIAAEWMKTLSRAGLGAHAFARLRQAPGSTLGEPLLAQASILVAGANFGCGSSREHAVWAMKDMGLKVVVAPSFSDIFAGNALRNGILPVVVSEEGVERLVAHELEAVLTVDLELQTIRSDQGWAAPFAIEPFWKERLLNGIDEIGATLAFAGDVERFEHSNVMPLPMWEAFGESVSR